jgi:hypothetical protein
MNNLVNGFWQAGFWDPSFWADGFWEEVSTIIDGHEHHGRKNHEEEDILLMAILPILLGKR